MAKKYESLRKAVGVMTAWVTDNPDSTTFSRERLLEYIYNDPDNDVELVHGFVDLAGVLLVRLETATGKGVQWHLQDIAAKSHGP